jgi:hypothetical protein
LGPVKTGLKSFLGSARMTRPELLKKLEEVIAEAERTRLFGTIEIEMRSGIATVLRTQKTERLGENPNAKPPYR